MRVFGKKSLAVIAPSLVVIVVAVASGKGQIERSDRPHYPKRPLPALLSPSDYSAVLAISGPGTWMVKGLPVSLQTTVVNEDTLRKELARIPENLELGGKPSDVETDLIKKFERFSSTKQTVNGIRLLNIKKRNYVAAIFVQSGIESKRILGGVLAYRQEKSNWICIRAIRKETQSHEHGDLIELPANEQIAKRYSVDGTLTTQLVSVNTSLDQLIRSWRAADWDVLRNETHGQTQILCHRHGVDLSISVNATITGEFRLLIVKTTQTENETYLGENQ